jgi:hypothetical protein
MDSSMPHSFLDAEHRLAVACAIAPAGLDPSPFVARALAAGIAAERLVQVAHANQLRPELAAALARAGALPQELAAAAAALAVVARAHEGHGRMLTAELGAILAGLRDAGIRAVPFKGPAFAAWLGDAPGLREMGDLDIFIGAEDIARAVAVMMALGLRTPMPLHALESRWLSRASNELLLERADDGTVVELHWRPAPAWYPAPLWVGDIFSASREESFYGEAILWPAPETLFLIHVADAMKSCGCGLRWVVDLARIVRRGPLDWARVRALAGRRHGLGNVRVALAVVARIGDQVAAALGEPALAVALPPPAQALAAEGERDPRSRAAVDAILARQAADCRRARSHESLRWAVQISDRPARSAIEVLRYLSGPAVADLEAMPAGGESDASLRYRSFRRRLANAA